MKRLQILVNLLAIGVIVFAIMHLSLHREPPAARINSIFFANHGANSANLNAPVTARLYDVRDIVRRQISRNKTPSAPSEKEVMDQIRGVIVDVVMPDDWQENGGLIGSINELSHWLMVCHTPDGHRAIASLLDTIRRTDSFQWPRRSAGDDSKER
jgi:hypothetical protein